MYIFITEYNILLFQSTIPHAYASIDSDMGALTTLRADLAASGMKISVNDFIIKAAALTLQVL